MAAHDHSNTFRFVIDNINIIKENNRGLEAITDLVVLQALVIGTSNEPSQKTRTHKLLDLISKDTTKNLIDYITAHTAQEAIDQRENSDEIALLDDPEEQEARMFRFTEDCEHVQVILDDWESELESEQNTSDLEIIARILEADEEGAANEICAELDITPEVLRHLDEHETAPTNNMVKQKKFFQQEHLVNLNKLAYDGKLDPVIGRDKETARTIQILSRSKKSNPLLVGEAGVGKTAIVEGFASRIVEGDVPENLKNKQVMSLDLSGLLAGTKYRGDFEKRFKKVIKSLKDRDDLILFIDEVHTIMGAGSADGSTLDMSNALKPELARGDIKTITGTTYDECEHIAKDKALMRRLQKVDVPELDEEHTIAACQANIDKKLKDFHGVTYTEDAILAAIQLSKKFISGAVWPDKPLDLLDDAGAAKKIKYQDPKERQKNPVTEIDIGELVAVEAKNDAAKRAHDDLSHIENLGTDLKGIVFGQDEAVDTVTNAVHGIYAETNSDRGPQGSFLFVGETGCGKTELTESLARTIGVELIRFDMSEFKQKHTVTRLIGSPPGYEGSQDEGELTKSVKRNPYCVLLLDEIEEAHNDIYSVLLQVLDAGRLTDNKGRLVDFSNVVVVMTTNAYDPYANKKPIGFKQNDPPKDPYEEGVKKLFPPKLQNRVTVVKFNELDKEVNRQIFDKFLNERLEKISQKRNVSVVVSDEAKAFIVDKSFVKKMSSRPMERAINAHVITPEFNQAVLFGELKHGGSCHITLEEENGEKKLVHAFTSAQNDAEQAETPKKKKQRKSKKANTREPQ